MKVNTVQVYDFSPGSPFGVNYLHTYSLAWLAIQIQRGSTTLANYVFKRYCSTRRIVLLSEAGDTEVATKSHSTKYQAILQRCSKAFKNIPKEFFGK